jgi:hypothetical protein
MQWRITGIGKRIECIRGPNGMVTETPDILRVAADYYKNLFRWESKGAISLDDQFCESSEMVSPAENAELVAPFLDQEIKSVVFDSYAEGAPGPDGLPFLFYQKFWDIIKDDLISLVQAFHGGNLNLFRLNFATLTLIPKIDNASEMKNYRPISLLNCSFKIFGKLLTGRLEKVSERLVAKELSAFIQGRYILKSVVIAHEVVHSLHKNKDSGVIIKLDYEKAYDRVNLDFLFEILKKRGFSDTWIGWVKMLVLGGSVSVMANGDESSTFKTSKGLRQGDPLSPLLFNLVGDVLTRMLKRASKRGYMRGILEDFMPWG